MNQNDIKIFLAIARTGSLNQAANTLYITQPALSQQLKALENELDTTLFNRKKGQRTISLTASGKSFLKIAQKFDILWNESMQLKHIEEIPSLSINAVGSLNTYLLQPLYIQLAMLRPPLSLTLATNKTHAIYQSIINRDFDIGFVNRKLHSKDVKILPLFRERMYFVCDKNSDYPDCDIHPEELSPAKEIYLAWSAEYMEWHSYWFDTSSRPLIFMDKITLIEQLITGTDYWAIVPASVISVFKNIRNMKSLGLTDPPPDRFCYALTHKEEESTPNSPVSLCMDKLYQLLDQNPWLEKMYFHTAVHTNLPEITVQPNLSELES